MSTYDADVLIVGGGVAGSAMAAYLLERDISVIVFEKKRFPRDKVCGEGIMPTGVRLLDKLGVLDRIPSADKSPFKGITFIAGRARASGDFPGLSDGYPYGLGIRRIILDDAARLEAEARGALYLQETGVESILMDEAPTVKVRAGGREWRGRLLVGADGSRSKVRRVLGLGGAPAKRRRYGVRAHLRFRDPERMGTYVEVYALSDGELYTSAVNAQDHLAVILLEQEEMHRFGGRLNAAYDEFIRRHPVLAERFDGAERVSEAMATGPLRQNVRHVVTDHALLVGDAAGFVDPITGEGVSRALLSASMAAPVIADALRAGDTSVGRLRPYEIRRRKEMRSHLIFTHSLLWLSRHPSIAAFAIDRMGRQPAFFSRLLGINYGRYGFSDLRLKDLGRFILGLPEPEGDRRPALGEPTAQTNEGVANRGSAEAEDGGGGQGGAGGG